jgi:hypothetical protein
VSEQQDERFVETERATYPMPPKADQEWSAEKQLQLLIRETLERNRAFVAGMAFGVPADAVLQYTDAIVSDLVQALQPLIDHPEDDGLEYAKVFGVYPDGRPYTSEQVDQQHP